MADQINSTPRVALTVNEAAKAASVSRRHIYVQIASGRLKTVKSGRRRLVRVADLEAWLSSLPSE